MKTNVNKKIIAKMLVVKMSLARMSVAKSSVTKTSVAMMSKKPDWYSYFPSKYCPKSYAVVLVYCSKW